MSRKLIDRDALIASIPKTNVDIFENCRNCSTLCDWQVRELIEQAELVDAVEVVHGEWIGDGFNPLSCSVCGATNDAMQGIRWADKFYNYCPQCGAKMDGEEK